MTYTGLASGKFSNVNLNGTSLPYLGDSLAYSSGSLELVSDATWNQAAGGSWTNAGNWLPTTVPASGSPLLFPELGANSSIAVMLDGPQSASALVFSASEGYSLSQGTRRRVDLGHVGSRAFDQRPQRHATISAPLVIAGGGMVRIPFGRRRTGDLREHLGRRPWAVLDAHGRRQRPIDPQWHEQ